MCDLLQHPDIVGRILSCLAWRERRQLAAVCVSWREAAETSPCWSDLDLTFADATKAFTNLVHSATQASNPRPSHRRQKVAGRVSLCRLNFKDNPTPFRWVQTLQLSVYSSEETAALLSLLLFPTRQSSGVCSASRPQLHENGKVAPDGKDTIHDPCAAGHRHLPAVIDDMDQDATAEGSADLLMPALRRLDVYRGVGQRGCGVFWIDTPVRLLSTIPSFFPVSNSLQGRQRIRCCAPSAPSTDTASSPILRDSFPFQSSQSRSVAALNSACDFLSNSKASESPSFRSEADDSPSLASGPNVEGVLPGSLPSFLDCLGPRSWRELPVNPFLEEVSTLASSAEDSPVERAESTASSDPPCQFASLPFLECLVVEAPLPITLIRGLRGRLPRLRHLSVTQVINYSSVERREQGHRNRELPSDLERLRALRSFFQDLPPNQLQTVCVSLACVPAPECLFEGRSPWEDTAQAEREEDSQLESASAWNTLIERVANTLPPEDDTSNGAAEWRTRPARGLPEDGDDVMELLTSCHAESLESLWLPDIPVSYPVLQRFLSQCKKIKSWHLAGWAALMAATLGAPL
ncbi:hypothetical protein TGARI_258900 [Toxoplasma gondii ARI]|uniref:F-box domain-containing protein n=1 Tax=Toxoplasma gondii ARI TaxID=1074872 RepID=A0A139XSD5_TOXGO|nr:hypothetical protein TGARI_258900 [Toxoplasma gondii ARI]